MRLKICLLSGIQIRLMPSISLAQASLDSIHHIQDCRSAVQVIAICS